MATPRNQLKKVILYDVSGDPYTAASPDGDVKVSVDTDATADFLGALSSDGALRVDATLDYADGGDFVTLGLDSTLKSNYDAGFTHVSNNGTDHSYIDQDVTTSGTPSFTQLDISGGGEARFYDVGDSNYIGLEAPALTGNQVYVLPATDGSASDIIKTDGGGNLSFVTPTVATQISLTAYDPSPARASESNIHGGLLALATGQPLNSVPTDLVVTKGIGKIMVVVNAGSDIAGDITITGESIDRNTGASTPADTDTITVDALTTDDSDTDGNGNTRHSFTGAYIGSKWFTGTVTLSTTDLTLTDVDVYHVSFEQFNDKPGITLNTFDVSLFTTNVNAEFSAYLYCLEVTGDKCDITRSASLNVGADGETAIANKYWRLRRGNLAKSLDGTTDGIWIDVFYSNSPANVEDVTFKLWATESIALTLT